MYVYRLYLDAEMCTICSNSTCFVVFKSSGQIQQTWLIPHESYLFVCAFDCQEHVDHVARDEEHGGEGHAPPNPLAPGREHVVTQGEGNHLHCTEQEDSLRQEVKRKISGPIIIIIIFWHFTNQGQIHGYKHEDSNVQL